MKERIYKNIPNMITAVRFAGTFAMLFIEPVSGLFYLVYTISGISDALDGYLARRMKVTSEFGAKMDSAADLLFYAVMLIRIFPELFRRLPVKIWYAVGGVVLLRLMMYLVIAAKFHQFASLHTYLNKISGGFIFAVPYSLEWPIVIPFCWTVVGVAYIAFFYEAAVHIRRWRGQKIWTEQVNLR